MEGRFLKHIEINHDGMVNIALGNSRKEVKWTNTQMKWSDFLKKVSNTIYTRESVEEYKGLTKTEQDNIKDVGGFVAGYLSNGRRKASNVMNRSIITLDIDFGKKGLWEIIEIFCDFACCIYSTHKHSADKPRLRLMIPLLRAVTPEEYEAVSRKIASDIGMEFFDETTYEPSRLMYWPSTSRDGEFLFNYMDEPWLNPDEVLSTYLDWKDTASWPKGPGADKVRRKEAEKQGNPREKRGILGAFCRTYTVPEAIENFLSHIYSPTQDGKRYTYGNGSTAGGFVIYEEGDFGYSHHGTDPVSGKLCNAFNLVRIHKFGNLDETSKDNTPHGKLPSFKAMVRFAADDPKVKVTLGQEKLNSIITDFGIIDNEEGKNTEIQKILDKEENTQWMHRLDMDDKGQYMQTIDNVVLILDNDPFIKGRIAFNEFSNRLMKRDNLPWHSLENLGEGDPWEDSDDASLRHYIEKAYGITHIQRVADGLAIVGKRRKYHPIREYLKGVQWDGIPRVENLLIDYLGAADSSYVKIVTRKALTAAVARVFSPGIKFDYMLVMVGDQGIGKSHIISLLGQNWFSDSLNTVQGKEAYEQLQDAWLIEMAELSATKNAEAESVKHFISKRADSYRMAYGKNVKKIPRQCIFFGTTNDDEFLKDKTGNRRFWPVKVGVKPIKKSMWTEMDQYIIDNIWSEAMDIWEGGEKLYLEGKVAKEATRVQRQHTDESSKAGIIKAYLDMLLPKDWSAMDLGARRHFIHGDGDFEKGTVEREKVCIMEIWMELFQGETRHMTIAQRNEIKDVLKQLEGWKPHGAGEGKLNFGKLYGNQRAYIRIDETSFL